ncbi:Serine/threonine-protein kinase PknA [Corynebacterium capitovis DSM 44611]|uniref:serine/threonine-protein kinase n=1 Tax=Corynebacterium capitovis TaxID=131081 RepID=UPI00035DDBA5|nr:serine/threonine-protein kinase [Corynebacterium capitovis]WKD56618.1 Serine/threonine-protein kinase PknA [Corynebacterium capitovis DSM 44611]
MNISNRDDLQELVGEDYRLQWIIGHGGMSTVWLADDTRHDREVAIKVLRAEFSSNEEFLTRFRNEALAAEGIASHNVVATYDYREVDTGDGYAMCFIVMEYIRGEALADLIAREGKLEESYALDILEQAARGLAAIHSMGLIHRDIKPGNLLITQNRQVKITDFGIAKAVAAVPLTRTGMVVGTAQYVSPEQAQGAAVTSASDVYSLGVVGYEMLAGRRPFTGDSSVSVALAHVSNVPPALSTAVSAPARELIAVTLRKEPTRRYADGDELAAAIAQVRAGHRPPQPSGSRTTQVATQRIDDASPTASTRVISSAPVPERTPTPVPTPAPAPDGMAEKRGGFGLGVALAVGLLLLLGGLAWAVVAGPLSGTSEPSTTQTPTVVTQTRTVAPSTTSRTTVTNPSTTSVAPRSTSVPPATISVEPTPSQTANPTQAPTRTPTPGATGSNAATPSQTANPGAPVTSATSNPGDLIDSFPQIGGN